VRFDLLDEVPLGLSAYELVYDLTTFDKKDSGDGSDAIVHADLGVVVHVYLAHVYLTGIFFGKLFDDGPDRTAGSTPFCPKVYYR
jgi:hypothetical protein